jgi:hypothetical protein
MSATIKPANQPVLDCQKARPKLYSKAFHFSAFGIAGSCKAVAGELLTSQGYKSHGCNPFITGWREEATVL